MGCVGCVFHVSECSGLFHLVSNLMHSTRNAKYVKRSQRNVPFQTMSCKIVSVHDSTVIVDNPLTHKTTLLLLCLIEDTYQIELEFDFCGGRRKTLGARRVATTNSTHIGHWVQDSNLGHIGRRQVLSLQRHCKHIVLMQLFLLHFYSHSSPYVLFLLKKTDS